MAIPQLKRYTTPAGNLGLTNIPNYQPSTQPPVLRGGGTPQSRYAEQQQMMGNQSQLDAEMRASAANRAQNLAMFGGAPSLARSQETQMLMDKAMSALGGTDVLQKKLAQKTIDQILGLESQSQTQQQSDVLDMQKARETLQMEQQSKLADLMAKREEIGQTRDFEREMLGAKSALEQQQLADKFGMDVALKKMELEAQAARQERELGAQSAKLSPYEVSEQRQQAKLDAEKKAEMERFSRTQSMLEGDYGKNIEKLISKSTGSYLGTALDELGRTVGFTTSGSKAAQEITPFGNQLVMMMPRGPGAQSDRDVKIAEGMAAAISDTTKTPEQRLAAYKGLKDFYKELSKQYGYTKDEQQQQTQKTNTLPDGWSISVE